MKSKFNHTEYMKEYREKNREKINKYANNRYYKNIDKLRKYQRNWNKQNIKYKNYSLEQKNIGNVKRATRLIFPLLGHFCELCGKKALEHHHNTNPIQFDKFNYVCHNCHVLIHKKFKGGKNI